MGGLARRCGLLTLIGPTKIAGVRAGWLGLLTLIGPTKIVDARAGWLGRRGVSKIVDVIGDSPA